MNKNIKTGAQLLFKGLKEEAEAIKEKVLEKFDIDQDGRIDLKEVSQTVISDARDGIEKLEAVLKDDTLSDNAKAELASAMDKIRPMVEAAKMEAEIEKEKIKAEIDHAAEVEAIKEEVIKK